MLDLPVRQKSPKLGTRDITGLAVTYLRDLRMPLQLRAREMCLENCEATEIPRARALQLGTHQGLAWKRTWP